MISLVVNLIGREVGIWLVESGKAQVPKQPHSDGKQNHKEILDNSR